jgi:hypothetical protein
MGSLEKVDPGKISTGMLDLEMSRKDRARNRKRNPD